MAAAIELRVVGDAGLRALQGARAVVQEHQFSREAGRGSTWGGCSSATSG